MKIRKAILTGGGRATRLFPITTTINKHLLPLANKPMIFHAIEKVVAAGITEIFINTNPGEKELQEFIGDGGHWGVKVTFFEQTGGPQGIAHVVNEAKKFIGDDPFIFYLSDNIILGSLDPIVKSFEDGHFDCMLALSKVPDPERFGVPVFDEAGKLIDVVEKPRDPQNDFAVTGIYLYGPKIFFDAFQKIDKSPRGEYEISSIHSYFLKHGFSVGYKEITGWWKDTGKPEDLLLANSLLLDQIDFTEYRQLSTIPSSAKVDGKIHVGTGSVIGKKTTLIGPVIIGENCVIEDAVVGPYVSLGTGTEIRNATVAHSLILEGAQIIGSLQLANSIVGKRAQLTSGGTTKKCTMIVGDKTVITVE